MWNPGTAKKPPIIHRGGYQEAKFHFHKYARLCQAKAPPYPITFRHIQVANLHKEPAGCYIGPFDSSISGDMHNMVIEYAQIVSGLLVGFLVGLTGVGGGSLMTPILVFIFGFAPKAAVGTDLLFAAITKTGGVLVHHGKHRSVDWKIVTWLCCGSIPAAMLVIWLLETVFTKDENITKLITTALGVALIFTSLALFIRNRLIKRRQQDETALERLHHSERFGKWQGPITILMGFVLGVLVTLSSVGAGALGTIALLFLYPRLATVRIVGTDLAHAIPLTTVAGLGHMHMGNVDFHLLGSLLIGSLPGIYVGSHLSARIPEKVLRPILATLLMIIGIKFVL